MLAAAGLGLVGLAAAGAHYLATGALPFTPEARVLSALRAAEKRTGLAGLATPARARELAQRAPVDQVVAEIDAAPRLVLEQLD